MKLDTTIAAVITGGASGLGAATARALADRGVKVALFDLNAEKGEALAAELGGVFCAVDVTDDESVSAGFAKAREHHGQERVLVNCAGIAVARKLIGRDRETGAQLVHSAADFEKVIRVNLVGTFRCIAKAAAGMVTLDPLADGERGAIVNTASAAAEDGQVGQAAYASSKAGIVGLTLPIARDLMNDGVRINTILPGIFETPLMLALPQKAQDVLNASVPFPKRMGRASEFAALALAMIENAYFNGEDVRLDGAIRMPPK